VVPKPKSNGSTSSMHEIIEAPIEEEKSAVPNTILAPLKKSENENKVDNTQKEN
jgi:hypothetical protein